MAPSMRNPTLLPLFALLALAAFAAPVLADKPVKSVNEWTYFDFSNVGTSTDTYTVTLSKEGCLIVADAFCSGDQFLVTINGQDKDARLTSAPSAAWCTAQIDGDFDSALTHPDFSKGYFPITGATSFRITVANTARGGGAFFRVTSKECPVQFKVVTASGLVTSRAAAVAACEAAGMTLADVTAADWKTVLDVTHTIPDIKLNPILAVVVNSWNGDAYDGATLQLSVSPASGAVTVLTTPAYPLCQLYSVSTLVVPAVPSAAKSFAGNGLQPKDTHNGRIIVGK
ncbi:hypothetical protein AMAG_08763 [Allomyces macrogynus ATCC 38327]|uniref:Uncharacterized protein n=1 Tax=Allomyces macrogynus (strain ATCC 38327) TaxID=578462 RepID=A0A0L0SM73_ALLM3|nr:hypothetical protein AMAG_08763 [Allomyces macrogynus ATCC 38327]|eukprot:KNE63661.1 hypothetical protein AMAG_08763 [Allomyces macrogynus ATCC 38327]